MVLFNRLALLEAAECAIKAFDQHADANLAAKQIEYQEKKSEWLGKYSERWLDAIPTLSKKIKRGEPITSNDLPKNRERYSGDTALFHERPPVRESVRIPKELENLKSILLTVQDDEVTTGGLQACGIPPSALREALSCMVPPTQKEKKNG
jgi:hypothetical protein